MPLCQHLLLPGWLSLAGAPAGQGDKENPFSQGRCPLERHPNNAPTKPIHTRLGRGREREKVPLGGSSDQSLTTTTTSASALSQGKAPACCMRLAGTGIIVPAVWDEDQAFLIAEICAQVKKNPIFLLFLMQLSEKHLHRHRINP